MLGLGGKLMRLYHNDRAKTITLAVGVGLAIVAPAVVTSIALALEPLYFCVLVLAYMFIAGRIIRMFFGKVSKPLAPILPTTSEEGIEKMLEERGFGELVKKRKKR